MNLRKIKSMLYIKFVAFFIGLACVGFSFFKNNLQENKFKEGNVIFVLDVSNSMNVKDVFYGSHLVSRLGLAKEIIKNNVEKINKQFGLILFSDKLDYFIPSTYDKKTFLTYLQTVNTNTLDGGNMKFVDSLSGLYELLNPTDTSIILSDFDTDEILSKIRISNYVYAIGLGKTSESLVSNKFGNKIMKNGELQRSAFSDRKLKEFDANISENLTSYPKGQVFSFLKDFKNKNLLEDEKYNNYLQVFGFVLIILSI